MAPDTPILLATSNPAKLDKLRWVLEGLPLTCVPLAQFPDQPQPEESGQTFEESARLKASQGSTLFRGLAIASDGGLGIPALAGGEWEALLTARAAGEEADDGARARHLLALMQGKQGEQRRVFWTEALALADRGRLLGSWQETGGEGYLTESYDPSEAIPGFWVYSLWHCPQFGKRYVELTSQELAEVDVTWQRLKARVQQWFYERDFLSRA